MCSKSLLLVSGDVLALLAFAAAGRANHGAGEVFDVETLYTALPFLIGKGPSPLVIYHPALHGLRFPTVAAHRPYLSSLPTPTA